MISIIFPEYSMNFFVAWKISFRYIMGMIGNKNSFKITNYHVYEPQVKTSTHNVYLPRRHFRSQDEKGLLIFGK